MRVAVIADVHGNRAALEAVLEDIDSLGVDLVVNLGDHLSGPLDAQGAAELLANRPMVCIRGNHDRQLLDLSEDAMGQSDRAAHAQLDARHRAWLAGLPPTALMHDEVFACHGTPTNDSEYWTETIDPDGRVRPAGRDELERRARGTDHAVLLCGHTHLPRMARLSGGRLLVSPGSVGCPGYDDVDPVAHVMESGIPDAVYAVIERRATGWQAGLRTVAYDAAEMIERARDGGRPEWARALATGWVVP